MLQSFMEKETPNLLIHCLRFSALTFAAFYLSMYQDSKVSHCVGKVEFVGEHKDIVICQTDDKHIIVQGINTDPQKLPEDVCELTQLWLDKGDKVHFVEFIEYKQEDWVVNNIIDLETGEISVTSSYQLPNNH